MKKAFKFLALALAVLPCCLAFAGCGKKLTNEDMYKTYKSALKATIAYDSSFTVTKTEKTATTIVRSDNKALTDEEKAALASQSSEDGELQNVVAFNKSTGEAYDLYYVKGENGFVLDESSQTYVVKEDDKWVLYNVQKDTDEVVTGKYVGNDYAAHENTISEFLMDSICEEKFIEAYPTWQSVIDYMEENVEEGQEATMTISEKKGNYTLVQSIKGLVNVEIYFDKNHITGIKYETSYTHSQSVDGEEGVTYNITSTMSKDTTIKYSYDSSRMKTGLKDKVQGQIENTSASVSFVLDGVSKESQEGKFGDTLTVPAGVVKDHTTAKWYLDEEMTQEFVINEQTKLPSYDINLYGKSQADEGYAVVVYVYDEAQGPEIQLHNLSVEVVQLSTLTDNKLDLKTTSFADHEDTTYEYKSIEGATYDATSKKITLTNKGYVVVHLTEVTAA